MAPLSPVNAGFWGSGREKVFFAEVVTLKVALRR